MKITVNEDSRGCKLTDFKNGFGVITHVEYPMDKSWVGKVIFAKEGNHILINEVNLINSLKGKPISDFTSYPGCYMVRPVKLHEISFSLA